MPLRKIVLSDGREASRNITDIRPNGDRFLPEEFTIPADNSDRYSKVYDMLAEIVGNIAAGNKRRRL